MTITRHSPEVTRSWQEFLEAERRLDAIYAGHRAAVACAVGAGMPVPDMAADDRLEAKRLEARIAGHARVLEQAELPPSARPASHLSEEQMVQACRLAGWSQRRIERKLAGERFARIDTRLGLLLKTIGLGWHLRAVREAIERATVPEPLKAEALRLHDEWLILADEVNRLEGPAGDGDGSQRGADT